MLMLFLDKDHFEDYSKLMNELFGDGCIVPLKIRMPGVFTIKEAE